MRPQSGPPHGSKTTSNVDYGVTQRNSGKVQDVTAFLLQPRLLPQQASVGAKSPASTLRTQDTPSSSSSDDLLLPASAWQPENNGGQGTASGDNVPTQRTRGLVRALTFRKGKGDTSRSPEGSEKRSLEEIRTNGVSRSEGSREHTSVSGKLKTFSLRSKPKEAPGKSGNENVDAAPSKTSRAKGSLTTFFGVSESAGRLPSSPRSRPSSIASIRSKNGSVPSLGEPAVCTPSAEASRLSVGAPRRKDELANVIKTLEGDYSKFQSKPMALKANVVRTTLLVFLKQYALHPSNKRLLTEDLDRRASILNKWWIGLLDMLDTKNFQEVAGLDKAAVFEGISGIMERPEWRCAPSSLCPLSERQAYTPNIRTPSDTSSSSRGSDALLESVHHNIRNMFIRNLHSQMVLVVDRMAVRNAPASLVAFCGKCCAYVFFFCPGMAEVLVRQWNVSAAKVKQIMNVMELRQEPQLKRVSEMIASNFPRCLHTLKLEPSRHMLRKLREKPAIPSTANIPWQGFWESRWSGKESDLFYIFLKHYHILAAEFLPTRPTKLERACVPGIVLIYSQMLTNLNYTLHRQITQKKGGDKSGAPGTGFEDIIDAKAMLFPTTMQMRDTPANASRLMAENRFIVILRDALEGRTASCPQACILFAQSFTDVLRASVATTSLYNHDACFTLCDFLQEALVILVTFELNAALEVSLIEWGFWFEVIKQMSQSENIMTDIRLFALLYTIWPTLSTYAPWKVSLCLDFLLDEEYFTDKFNHWSPIVRTYYMRLLCWRISRIDAEMEASDDDLEILETLSSRLRHAWSTFNKASEKTKIKGLAPYPATPSNPAPNRRLFILRTEPPPSSSFSSLSSVVPSSIYDRSAGVLAKSQPSSWSTGFSTATNSTQLTDLYDLELSPEFAAKKKSSLFRSLLGVSSPEIHSRSRATSVNSSSRASSRNTSPDKSFSARSPMVQGRSPRISEQRSPMLAARSPRFTAEHTAQSPLMQALSPRLAAEARGLSPKVSAGSSKSRSGSDATYTPAHFKFSLENVEKRPKTIPSDLLLHPPKLPTAAHTLLQGQLGPAAEVGPKRSTRIQANNAVYSGPALAEWGIVVLEHQHFIERRRNEGVPLNKLVETPALSVDSFRKMV